MPERSFFSKTTRNASRPPTHGSGTAMQVPRVALPLLTEGDSRHRHLCATNRWTESQGNAEKPPLVMQRSRRHQAHFHASKFTQPKAPAPVRPTAQAPANPQFRYIVQSLFILGYLHARCQGNQVISRKCLARGPASPSGAGETRGLAGIAPAQPPPRARQDPGTCHIGYDSPARQR